MKIKEEQMSKKKKEVVEVQKEEAKGMDKFDLEAEREGIAIQKMSANRVKRAGVKPKVKPFKGDM